MVLKLDTRVSRAEPMSFFQEAIADSVLVCLRCREGIGGAK